MERAAELTRNDKYGAAFMAVQRTIETADGVELSEIQQWLTDHGDDFVGDSGEKG
ncbi:hypothetical protein HUT13_14800 [Streptomyces harbinensis]|uniref:hypothetical protein n=1 Tax=Streptomyces harbinensis TaxID=1176198 RepID=UPI001590A136|nr:hypothetical protein [Streptomyces harbinensis]QKV69905.1 hypothetical protein HUT13_14800 [Streptomyces harbinensis]